MKTGLAILLAGLIFEAAAEVSDRDQQRMESSVAIGAKLLCSGIFVMGRDLDSLLEIDLRSPYYCFHDWGEAEICIDREAMEVTVTTPGLAPRSARYIPGVGAVLLPEGHNGLLFTPPPPVATSEVDTSWPGGLPVSEPSLELAAALDWGLHDPEMAQDHRTRALVVLQAGRLVGEAYADGYGAENRHLSWSMGKSLGASLIGRLVHDGLLTLETPPPIEAWRRSNDPRHKIRLIDLLRMSGGLAFRRADPGDPIYYTPEHDHESVYFEAQDTAARATGALLQYVPGSTWRYRNSDTLSLMAIYRRVLEVEGRDWISYPQTELLHRIGATSFVLETDAWGNFIISGYVYATARDWARWGQLHLDDGQWGGQRLLPEDWVALMTFPAPALAPRQHYGGQLWLNRDGRLPDVPRDAYFALGWLGQYVLVVPSREAVIVRMGHSELGSNVDYFNALFVKILQALP